ncbi:Gfo/Idh/MocA family oxidoreductase [Paenibacillus validus]|uniref:Gfo/Idh/MocA family oxidoreductase n=1 Tax=Paenibacillus validus TaxID=44253 RepID=A0A7X2Z8V0_9BACL|nr:MULTISPECIES: Gfo/Idh/MocA family oxidoreductase [Paenibacillus]MED4601371.1 Gfo/Idh/MocA family oxidoreductase [Paenibacillus validus]MED4608114.1 Gfo/Idh/MocA family oxidoreductase [Paenibacillus validus]MUG70382.1 gfo/Idh/MocA family oxidoreductase [Paenibacillus validus]
MISEPGPQRPVIRVGIAGLGTATKAMLPAFLKHPGIRITAAASLDEEQLRQFHADFAAETYPSVERMCLSPEVDAVYIATPTPFHTEHVLLAASAKKHIILEKPIATSLEEALRMVTAAEAGGVTMVVGHSHSFDPPILKMREVLESGIIGKFTMAHTWCYTDWMYRPRLREELRTELGGGVTFRQGAHQFDIIRLLGGGKVRSIRASAGAWDPKRPTEGSHVVFFDFEDGASATAVYNGYDHFHTTEWTSNIGEWGERVTAGAYASNRKTIRAMSSSQEQALKSSRSGYNGKSSMKYADRDVQQPFFGLTIVSGERGDIRQTPEGLMVYGEEGVEHLKLPQDVNGRDKVVEEFYEAVIQGKRPVHDGRWGLANLEICLAALKSSQEKKEIVLSHQVPLK